MEVEIDLVVIGATLVVGTLLHPFAMLLTRRMLMEHEGSLGLFFKVTLMLAAVSLFSIFALFLALITTGRRSVQLLIVGPACWFVGVKALCVHYLEKEEVDEWMVMFHYALLHAGLYFVFSRLLAT